MWLREGYETSRSDSYSKQWVRERRGRAEFLSKTPPKGKGWSNPKRSPWSKSPVRGVVSPSPISSITPGSSGSRAGQDFYSSFHKTRNRTKFTKNEWDEFTQDSTRQAISELVASPEFTDWMIDHADRIKLLPTESSDEEMGSESDSTEVGSGSETRYRIFNWGWGGD
ncbi:hypothetical protein PIB30_056569 [Stylosanthes scabra]|uniref:Uncharacterized protein n=1 Tax=Stylosanthes scabra TaxID=79078 RepID=A0ABU6ZI47_9FABA|nr:hypothetical protein [Stylosanthes scabra]